MVSLLTQFDVLLLDLQLFSSNLSTQTPRSGFFPVGESLKGQCHDIQWFFWRFCTSKKWRLLAQGSRTSDLKAWPAAAWQPRHLAGYWHAQWTYDELSKSCTASLVDGNRLHFCFHATRPGQGDIPFFKVQDWQWQPYRYRFFILVFRSARIPKLASAISSPRAWVTGRRIQQCGRSSLCSDSDDVCHWEGKCAKRGTSSRKGCRRTYRPANRLCCGIRTVRDKDLKTQETRLW